MEYAFRRKLRGKNTPILGRLEHTRVFSANSSLRFFLLWEDMYYFSMAPCSTSWVLVSITLLVDAWEINESFT